MAEKSILDQAVKYVRILFGQKTPYTEAIVKASQKYFIKFDAINAELIRLRKLKNEKKTEKIPFKPKKKASAKKIKIQNIEQEELFDEYKYEK